MILTFNNSHYGFLEESKIESIVAETINAKRYGSKDVTIVVNKLTTEEMDSFIKYLKDGGKAVSNQYNVMKVAMNVIKNPSKAKVGSLQNLPTALSSIFASLENGLIFKNIKGINYAYMPTSVKMVQPREAPNYVEVTMTYFEKGQTKTSTISYESSDIKSGASAVDMLMVRGFVLENNDLISELNEYTSLFLSNYKVHGKQYLVNKFTIGERWDQTEFIPSSPVRMVNNFDEYEKLSYPKEIKVFGKTKMTPVHPYLPLFSLDKHTNTWVHIENTKDYIYNPELKSKLVLDPDHEDLIDALSETYTIDIQDIVEDKSGGTVVLCKGGAGIGKTLTAEVLAEVIKKPLYKINVSLLGTEPDKIESKLQLAFNRANSWGAILLLDEADLYIMERGSDIKHNAIVTVFLKGLEYSKGMTFLTTNKGKDIDDAILSRCTAILSYSLPSEDARLKLWNILSAQFNLSLSNEECTTLAETFTTASGRDIKMMCILVYKYCTAKKLSPSVEIFKKLSVFRGLSNA